MATYSALYKPPLTSSWNPWILASRSGYNRPFSSPLPLDWFPARTISLYSEFANNFICISSSDVTALGLLGWSMAGATMALSIGIPTSLSISYTRARGNHGTLGFTQRFYDPALSPRYGYSIGNLFKHQAYFTMQIVGMGWNIALQNVWLITPGVMQTETCSNARLRRIYLKQGKVLGIRFGPPNDSGQKTMFVKICEKDLPPPKGLSCPSITIHTMKGDAPSTESLAGNLTVGWEIESSAGADTFIQEGDYFTLATPLMLEDPANMHEYGLTNDQYWRTKQQQFEIETDIIGSWVQTIDEKLGAVYMAHVAGANQSLVTLPSSETEAIRNQESMEYGGSPNDAFDGSPNTVRLIMNYCGGPGLQNFCAGNLIGEFAEIGGKHYEIVAHPRNDTISISTYAAEDGEQMASMPAKAKIFQQKFWMTSELFFGGAAVRAFSSFGQTSGGTNWNVFEPKESYFELDEKEQVEIGCKNLLERHIKDVGPGGAIKAYEKFERWKAYIGGKAYKIKGTPSISHDKVQVEVEGDVTDSSGISFVTPDTPYEPVGALGNTYASATFAPALDQMGTWTIYMQGSYSGGIFTFPQQIPDDSIFSIVSNSFTVYPAAIQGKKSWGLGNPFVYISTQKGVPQGIGATEIPLSGQPFVFFNDPHYNYLAYRTSLDPEWTEEREQGLVRIGHFKEGTQDASDTDFVTGVSFATSGASLSGTYGGGGKAHWITTPNSSYSSDCPYFATQITGAGGVISPYIRDKGLADESIANGAWMPFEVYPSEGGGKTFFPMYIPVKDVAGVGWVEANEGNLKKLMRGESVSASAGGGGSSEKQITPSNRLVHSPGVKDAFAFNNGTIGLVYSSELQYWSFGSGSELPTNALCVITSDNAAYDWGSPKVDKPANAVASANSPIGPSAQALEATEWGSPLVLLLDFEMVGSLIRSDIFELFCFGYVYEPGEEAYKDINKLSLVMYRVAIPDLILGETYDIIDTRTEEQIAKYRQSTFSGKFGRFGGSGGAAEYLNENLIKIIGNSETQDAQISGSIDKEIVAPMWMGETIRVFMYSAYYKGIISIVSDNLGEVWQLETQGDEPLMYSRGEGGYPVLASPGVFGQIDSHNLMFYIADNSLLCKRIDLTGEGSSTQEKLDKSIPTVVAVDVQEHKCVSTSDRSGRLLVYYLSSQGILTAAVSPDCGDHWETLKNF